MKKQLQHEENDMLQLTTVVGVDDHESETDSDNMDTARLATKGY